MRKLVVFCVLLLFVEYINAQSVVNPVFDRTDVPAFRVQKVEINKDTTYVWCSYSAEEHSWANISDRTYLENIQDGCRYPIIKVSGLPFGPEKRHFNDTVVIEVVLYFPSVSTDKINIVENEEENAFNIYGIDLAHSYESSFTNNDIIQYYNSSNKKREEQDYTQALDYTLKQLEASNYVRGIRSLASAASMFNLTMDYYRINNYKKMIEWGEKAIDILRSLPQDSITLDMLARTYENVSSAYSYMKQFEKAKQFKELSLNIRRMGEGIGAIPYVKYLQDLAKEYYYEDNYPKALLYGKEVVEIYKKKYDESNYKYGCVYVNSLSNCCEFCQRMDKFEEAIDYGRQALSLIEKGACQDSVSALWLKHTIYTNLAGAMATLGQVDNAIEYLEYVIYDNTGDGIDKISSRMLLADILLNVKQDTIRGQREYISLLNTLSDSLATSKKYYPSYIELLHKLYKHYKENDSTIALQYLKRHIDATKEYNGEESVSFANACISYLNDIDIFSKSLAGDTNGKDTLFYYLRQSSEIIKRHICGSIYTMSNRERTEYWQRYKYIYSWFVPTICSFMGGDKEACSLAYDAALFYKGMLLSADKEYKDVIISGQDTSLVKLYAEYINNLSILESPRSYNYSKAYSDSLKCVIHEQEYSLSQKATRYNKNYKGTNFSWKEVKSKLKDEDVAIEITTYLGVDGTNTYYDAYIISNNSIAPTILFLCDENQLRDCIHEDSIDYYGLSKLIWGNKHLFSFIKDKKNIFVSASGLLNTIGFEYLPLENGQYIFDLYNIYRLSSTRELCSINNPFQPNDIILYGGLDYNYTSKSNANNAMQTIQISRSVVDSLISRGGIEPLLGSKQEVYEVKNELLRHNVDCVLYTDSEGTEESFKGLSGSQVNIIHLSTHGMYVPVEEQKNYSNSNYNFILSGEYSGVDEEAVFLSHSFLVMSGSNIFIHNDGTSINKEDGILTALEISHLDFSNLDLVVLSACETGLGEIDSEGVYGLQRGFKKAGANTILMSLDKVDDEATRILMVEFYKNLMSGKTKHQSLKHAQKYLRQAENGKYDDPKYWASFIMLDGLD